MVFVWKQRCYYQPILSWKNIVARNEKHFYPSVQRKAYAAKKVESKFAIEIAVEYFGENFIEEY